MQNKFDVYQRPSWNSSVQIGCVGIRKTLINDNKTVKIHKIDIGFQQKYVDIYSFQENKTLISKLISRQGYDKRN